MADKNIGALDPIPQLDDDSLLVVEQQGQAGKMTGAQFKQFALDAVEPLTERAEEAAEAASVSEQAAKSAESGAATSRSAAAGSAAAAQAAETAAREAQAGAAGSAETAEYWANQANNAAGGGVSSFNGRAGFVMPQAGDYDAGMVGAAHATYPTAAGEHITVDNAGDYYLQGLTIYGKSTQDGTPSPDAPVPIESVGDKGTVVETATGKNLFDVASYPFTDGYYIDINTGYYMHGGAAATAFTATQGYIPVMGLGGVKIVHNNPYAGSVAGVAFYDQAKDFIMGTRASAVTVPDNAAFMRFTENPTTKDNAQWEIGTESSEYEPYRATTATLTTGLPLCGIPVTSGGNVTINGQQYIADTIEVYGDGTGKVVKRTKSRLLTANDFNAYFNAACGRAGVLLDDMIFSPTSKPSGFCSVAPSRGVTWGVDELACFFGASNNVFFLCLTSQVAPTLDDFKRKIQDIYDNGGEVKIIYMLATPTELPLTAAEVQAVLALRTYTPVSTLWNDEGAHQEIVYCDVARAEILSKMDGLSAEDVGAVPAQATVDGEIELANPPMLTEREYRTVERWGNKAVYCQRIKIASLPAANTNFTYLMEADVTGVARIEGTVLKNNIAYQLPYIDGAGAFLCLGATIANSGSEIDFRYSSGFAGSTLDFVVYYTKD